MEAGCGHWIEKPVEQDQFSLQRAPKISTPICNLSSSYLFTFAVEGNEIFVKLIISRKKFISCCLSTFVYYYVYSYYCYVFFMYNISSYKCWYFENSQKFLVTTFVRICAIFYYVLLLLLQRFCDFYLLLLVTRTQKPPQYLHYCQIVKSIFNNKCFYFVKCQKSAVF